MKRFFLFSRTVFLFLNPGLVRVYRTRKLSYTNNTKHRTSYRNKYLRLTPLLALKYITLHDLLNKICQRSHDMPSEHRSQK